MITGGKLGGRDVAKAGMQAFSVIQIPDEPVQMLLSVIWTEVILEINLLTLQDFVETLHTGVVIEIAFPGHARDHAHGPQAVYIHPAGVLNSLVRVVEQTCGRTTRRERV